MRWIVGDLQGCARELEALLKLVDFDPARDELWAAGDIVNRGPDSLATARLWRELGGRGVIVHGAVAVSAGLIGQEMGDRGRRCRLLRTFPTIAP